MAAKESQHQGHPVNFFSADSSSRGEAVRRESSGFQQRPKPPPPVALSLRTRESSALALKHIFDQIYSGADNNLRINDNTSSRAHEKQNTELRVQSRDGSSAGFQGGRNQVSPSPGLQINSTPEGNKLYKSDMESSFSKVQPQFVNASTSNSGPPSLSLAVVHGGNLPILQTSLSRTVSRASLSSPSLKQPTSQLTIFYAGTVNIYDEVPADKANAIMLLAGTGNSLSMKPGREEEKEQIPPKLSSPSPPSHMGVPSPMVGGSANTTSATPTTSKTFGFFVPSTSNLTSNPLANTVSTHSTPSSAVSMTIEAKPNSAPKKPHAGIELPHARKASLARFLEKRKDRVQFKPEEVTPEGEEKVEINRTERPLSPKKPRLTGSTSSPTFEQ